ncbi:glycosyltransferase family 2 protein [Mannheimia sp. HC-2023]|uniref:glycosyltransferase family 2 protein n=1 Tax=Mannheimia indoligenes TaxID=3103145 RepID=UPI002FE682DB
MEKLNLAIKEMNSNPKVCAVVVTYNRKELLLNCLQFLIKQTYPIAHIVVVNNASTDDTINFLEENGWINSEKLTLLTLPCNKGGAGGFYEGLKYAYEHNFEYIWLMDDDGYPSENCLENLVNYISEDCYIGPMVLEPISQDKLSFALRVPNSLQIIDSYSSIPDKFKQKNFIRDIVLPFNGTLISRQLVKNIGLIKEKYFIWGDDKEYTIRASKSGANILTVIDAIFYHPADSSSSTKMFFGKLRFNYSSSNLKLYCFCRNAIDIFKLHGTIWHIIGFWLKTTWFFMFTKPSVKELIFTWRAMWHGLRDDFSHHIKYL